MFRFRTTQEVALVRALLRRRITTASSPVGLGLLERLEAIPTTRRIEVYDAVRGNNTLVRLALEVAEALYLTGTLDDAGNEYAAREVFEEMVGEGIDSIRKVVH